MVSACAAVNRDRLAAASADNDFILMTDLSTGFLSGGTGLETSAVSLQIKNLQAPVKWRMKAFTIR